MIATHRINDYHPDHRYTGLLVQDSCYMVMVPNVLPTVPVPPKEPVVVLMYDKFTKPNEIQPDLVIDIDSVIEKKLDSFTCHVSQVEEWMPSMAGNTDEIPADPQARRAYFRDTCYVSVESQQAAARFRGALVARVRPGPRREREVCRGIRDLGVRGRPGPGTHESALPILTMNSLCPPGGRE